MIPGPAGGGTEFRGRWPIARRGDGFQWHAEKPLIRFSASTNDMEALMRHWAIPFLLLASFVAAGCASGGQAVFEVDQRSPLTEADMADYQNHTALGVIRVLRPEWVATNPDRIKVFLGPCRPRRFGRAGKTHGPGHQRDNVPPAETHHRYP